MEDQTILNNDSSILELNPLQYSLSDHEALKLDCINENIVYQYYHIVSNYFDDESYIRSLCNKQHKLLNFIASCEDINLTSTDFICILIYMKRLSKVKLEYYLTNQNINYILLVIIILYDKMYNDFSYENTFYSKTVQANTSIINWTELMILRSIRLFIPDETFQSCNNEIEKSLYL